jgi:outer membrane protein OmpA-like peptidoglycan-associated protein
MNRNAILFITLFFIAMPSVYAQTPETATVPAVVEQPKKAAAAQPVDKLPWWPTDAQPGPVRDEQRGGFWWWPSAPGTTKDLWGNRGYAYVNKIIYDWQGGGSASRKSVQVRISDVGFVETEQKPSLLVKRIIKSQKLQFKDNTAEIKPEHAVILKKAAETLKRNKDAEVLITAYSDTSEIASARTQAVQKFFIDQGILQERIKVLAFEKFREAGLFSKRSPEAGAVVFVIAELKEVMIPGPK